MRADGKKNFMVEFLSRAFCAPIGASLNLDWISSAVTWFLQHS